MSNDPDKVIQKFGDFTYFDNVALWYLCNETPPQTLALAFLNAEEKVCGSMLGVLDAKRREYVHQLMAQQQGSSEESRQAAADGMLIIADGLITRNLIRKEGKYFFGTKK
ncbi:hypothetical protein [Leptospira sp. GIMC2001]|uniref:hypothetical protein n=1 Tax=Leptospira sp. GIMC2001 TaxID=1513297 RepID=UPI0023494FD6|nr:hypothetical protein [Leptospira sp. GIMC2001]WCL49406.1 hypothetical protein O4O04_19265 [Leptospira sp. GIMC2001]